MKSKWVSLMLIGGLLISNNCFANSPQYISDPRMPWAHLINGPYNLIMKTESGIMAIISIIIGFLIQRKLGNNIIGRTFLAIGGFLIISRMLFLIN